LSRIFLGIFLSVLAGCAHLQKGESADHNIQVESFDYAWSRIGETYYDPEMNGLDWDALSRELRPQAAAAKTNEALRPILKEMMARLGESHFAILPEEIYAPRPADEPESSEGALETEATTPSEESTSFHGSLGLKISLSEGQAYLREVAPDSDAYAKGLRVGWKLLAVNEHLIAERLEELAEHIQDKRALDFYGTRLLIGLLDAENNRPIALSLEDTQGEASLISLRPHAVSGTENKMGMLPEFLTVYESEIMAENRVGYVRFTEWAPPIVERFTESVSQFRKAGVSEGLIVDLRENPGGVVALSMGVAGHLVSKKGKSLGLMRDKNMTLHLRVFPRPPSQRWEGPVVILIDGLSASTSEIFAAGLQDLGEATIIGTQSAGMALASMIETLPNGDRIQFVIWNLTRTNGERVERAGVTPDQIVTTTAASLQRGQDPVLQAALDFLLVKAKEDTE
jgi:carboxyl-terminal processing protease